MKHYNYLALSASLLLVACGGGGGGEGDSSPPSRTIGSISGNVYDAPVSNAKVYIWEYDNGQQGRLIASTKTDSRGNYSVSVESASRPVLIRAEGGSYIDPVTGEEVSISANKVLKLDSVVNYVEGSQQSVMVTPLTNMAAGLTKHKLSKGISDSSAVSQSISAISDMYGFDVNTTEPIDITNGAQSAYATDGHKYGALLTAYSSYAKDLITQHGGNTDNQYTSINLASIQYNDISSDGLLDGMGKIGNHDQPLDFGAVRVTSELYTNELAKHVMIVANSPELNKSSIGAEEFDSFGKKVNAIGSGGDTNVIPKRDETAIDSTPPVASRPDETENDVIARTGSVEVKLEDEVGVDVPKVVLESFLSGTWTELDTCQVGEIGSGHCAIDVTGFEKGLRSSNVKVKIDTVSLDQLNISSGQARLVFYTVDVLGNTIVKDSAEHNPHIINFSWDNQKPIIKVISGQTIRSDSTETDYILFGTVTESSPGGSAVTVSFKGDTPEELVCSPTAEEGTCEFSNKYPLSQFSTTSTKFEIRATDAQGNIGEKTHTVTKDDQPPSQDISYPATQFNFVLETASGDRTSYPDAYTRDTYDATSVITSKNYLKIDYQYAASKIKNNTDLNFQSFTTNYLDVNKIPYIKVVVEDARSSDGVDVGSPANKLKLEVRYFVKKDGQGEYELKNTTTANAFLDQDAVRIPHEAIVEEEAQEGEDKWVSSMTYYIPLTRDILGDSFSNVSELDAQKLVIRTSDDSKNYSSEETVYFKTTFDLPTYTVVTPFVGALAQLEGLNTADGEFIGLTTCQTSRRSESNSVLARDVATCSLTTDIIGYDFLRIRLASPTALNTHYFNWTNDSSDPVSVNLDDANFGVYFKPDGSSSYYVTELSAYHTGLFDYRWNNYQGAKDVEAAESILAEVKNALALKTPGSFFGFDPTTTSYATNEMLLNGTPSQLSVEYQHRFLAESIASLSEKALRYDSAGFATAFYDDLSADGKPDGKGKSGSGIKLDNYELNAETYRTDLAQAYFDLLTGKHTGKPWVTDSIAQLFADDISKARPMLGTLDLFGKDGVSIDQDAPNVELTVAGRTYTDKNQQYVAGPIEAKLVVSDPSGIKDDASTRLTFAPMWYKRSTPNDEEPANDISFTPNVNNDEYVKQFAFSVNTALSEHKDKVELAIHTSAMDNQGNGYGYPDNKRKDSLFIDNEPPKISLIRPEDPKTENQLEDSVYLNTNNELKLQFNVVDTVNDQKEKRVLLFKDSSGKIKSYDANKFAINDPDSFVINLCKEVVCDNKPVYPGEGDWEVYVKAIDNLGNEVNENSISAPKFTVRVDSVPPEVENRTAEKMLGGNTTLNPAPIWGDHSPGDKLDLQLKIGNVLVPNLGLCSDDDTVPCLEGTQPNVGVKLVADAFTHGQTNTLFYTATDKAYPPNTSGRGEIKFQVDKQGPVINFQDPWLVDYVSQKTGVLGAKFSAKFNSVTDDSGVEKISLYQKTDSGETFLKDWTASEWSSSFEGTYSAINDENKIVTDDSNRAKLFVKATDIHGFVSSSNVSNVIIDTQGPSLKLNGHQENDFYVPGYELTIIAEDYDDNGSINSNGVNKDKFEYWIFKGDVAPNGEGTKPKKVDGQYKIPLPSNLDTTGEDAITVKLKAQDIRGNVSTVPFKLHIKQTPPAGRLIDVVYASNNESIGTAITKDDHIKLLLEISDISGIGQITGSYHFGSEEAGTTTDEEAGTTLSFTKKGEKQWESVIQKTALAKDGTYTVSIYAYNKAKYLDGGDNAQQIPLKITETLSVQKKGVRLKVKSPEDFQNFIANGELKVDFEVTSAVTPNELQCWVRENYTLDQAPTDEGATSGLIKGELGNTPSCTVKSNQNFQDSPVVLIVQTKGTNGTPNVQRFTFNQMDVNPPTSGQKDYLLKGEHVIPASQSPNNKKQLSIQLGFTDDQSGVNISNIDQQDFRPYLARINNITPIRPKECLRNSDGQVTCSYIADYATFIASTDAEHIFNVKNVNDNAGNTADVSQLSLKLPEGKPTVAITSTDDIATPLAQNTVVKDQISINLKTLLPNGSKLEVLTVKVGDTTYSTANTNHKDNFGAVTKCGENDEYLCSEFNADLSGSDAQSLTVTARAMDVFNLKSALNGESNQVTFIVDKEAPKVGKTVVIESQPGDKVRFTFPITDSGSGLAKVTYTVTELGTNFTREEKKGDDPTYFEVEASELANKNKLTVTVTAEDKAGHVYTENNMEVNIALPTVALSLKDNPRIEGGLLVLGRTSQEMTLEVNATSSITAKSYRITLVPVSTGESIEQSATFVGTSATSTFSFKDTDQGQYMLKVAVTDSIGRTLETFTYAGNEYGVEGIKSVVDTQDPSVSNLKAEQTTFAPDDNGEYLVEVTANVLDTNLKEVNAELALKAGGNKILPKSVEEPTDDSKPYVFSFSVPAGVYRVSINARDLAGKVNSSQEIETTVVAATTPEVKAISATPQGPIGGDKQTQLKIEFSEKVQDFTLSDIKLTQAGGSDDVGTLSGLSTTDNIIWIANYKAPQGEDKTITFTLEDDAYQSEKGIKGKGDTFNLEVKGVLPTVKSLSLNPEYADTGDTINVTVEFSQPVSEPSESYLNTSTTKINWDAASGESDRWTGKVKVPSANDTDLEMPIVIAGFSDTYTNEGVAHQDKKLLLKPKVTITELVVSARKVTVKGTTTRTGTSATLKLTFEDESKNTVSLDKNGNLSDGAFEQTVTFDELSSLASGSVDVTAVVTNSQNASGEESDTFTLDKQAPTLASTNPVSFNPGSAVVGTDGVTVTVTFDEAVTKPLGSQLGGETIIWDAASTAKTVWVGQVNIRSTATKAESLPLSIKGFEDASGNPGAENTDHQFALQPVVTISEVTVSAGVATVKGSMTQSGDSAKVALTFSDTDDGTPDVSETYTLLSSDSWTQDVDVSSLTAGTITVKAVVTNSQNASGEESDTFTLDKQAPTLASTNPVSFNPGSAVVGTDGVTVTVTFDEAVTQPLGSQLGGETIIWDAASTAKTVWVGQVNIRSTATKAESLPLSIKGFEDASGNPGAENTDHQFALQPVVTISEVTVSAGVATVKGSMTQSGDSAKVALTFSDTDDGTPDVSETYTLLSSDSWTQDVDVSSLAAGTITVKAVVTNSQNASGEESDTFTLDKQAPTLASTNPVSFNPGSAVVGTDGVTVTVTFDEAVTQPLGSQLGGETIIWDAASTAKTVWVGQVNIRSTATKAESLPLSIKGFEDASGNPGAENTDHQFALQPVVTISEVTVSAGVATVKGSMTQSGDSAKVALTFSDTDDGTPDVSETYTLLSSDSWTQDVDVSSLTAGTITVKAVVTNSQNASGEESDTFTLDKQAPTLASTNPVSFNPGSAVVGTDGVTVTVTFEAVTQPLGSQLGGETIIWDAASTAKTVWVGQVNIRSTATKAESLPLSIKGFEDASGNPGAENTDHQFALQPVVTISEVTVSAGVATVKGSMTQSGDSAKVALTFSDTDDGTPDVSETYTLLSSDSWTQDVDVSSLAAGTITVKAVVTNSQNASGEESDTFTLDKQAPTLASTNPVSFNPGSAVVGTDGVTVTVTFDEAVTQPLGSQLGGETIIWDAASTAKTVWVGQVNIRSTATKAESLPLSIKGFEDASGNPGAENTDHQFALQPVVTISEVTVSAGVATVKGSMTQSGDSAKVALTFSDTDDGTPDVSETYTLLSSDSWTQDVDVSSLTAGTITVKAVVTNSQNASGEGSDTFTLN
ncbi:tandem large repeat [Vibrio sp. SCSIO 43145]|uniref:tandem large repeat n=1 Tax=Vibrio sp. SCSIO 43145 TaxID=2819097 RepID=UPI002074C7F3|nr:tandem large repeat [Vibrio sp. SCSIO 43145]USD47358.1 tandem large repeat [Vibrio sp. SCSIO 43145]